jgi:two-component system sensor histidine kinase SenX3
MDQGPGIAAEHQQKIFERFYRVDKARSRASGGAGLGLSIARWAVERQAGQIELESDPGHGSLFRIVIPNSADSPLSDEFLRKTSVTSNKVTT